jgi:hypothetical protein
LDRAEVHGGAGSGLRARQPSHGLAERVELRLERAQVGCRRHCRHLRHADACHRQLERLHACLHRLQVHRRHLRHAQLAQPLLERPESRRQGLQRCAEVWRRCRLLGQHGHRTGQRIEPLAQGLEVRRGRGRQWRRNLRHAQGGHALAQRLHFGSERPQVHADGGRGHVDAAHRFFER